MGACSWPVPGSGFSVVVSAIFLFYYALVVVELLDVEELVVLELLLVDVDVLVAKAVVRCFQTGVVVDVAVWI